MTRTISRDLVAGVSSTEGWKYPLVRLLTDTEGNAAVFVHRGKGPTHTFRIKDPNHSRARNDGEISPIRGTITTEDGHKVTFHRRGASCTWKLARCNVKTPALEKLWPEPETPIKATPATPPTAPTIITKDTVAIRTWARENGFKVGLKGRIPASVVKAYEDAHDLI